MAFDGRAGDARSIFAESRRLFEDLGRVIEGCVVSQNAGYAELLAAAELLQYVTPAAESGSTRAKYGKIRGVPPVWWESAPNGAPAKGAFMSEQERERPAEGDEPEVEGHRKWAQDEGPSDEEAGRRREGDDPDVEGHIKR